MAVGPSYPNGCRGLPAVLLRKIGFAGVGSAPAHSITSVLKATNVLHVGTFMRPEYRVDVYEAIGAESCDMESTAFMQVCTGWSTNGSPPARLSRRHASQQRDGQVHQRRLVPPRASPSPSPPPPGLRHQQEEMHRHPLSVRPGRRRRRRQPGKHGGPLPSRQGSATRLLCVVSASGMLCACWPAAHVPGCRPPAAPLASPLPCVNNRWATSLAWRRTTPASS